MRSEIIGTTMPVLQLHLDPGETAVSAAGEFAWMSDTIRMRTGMGGGGASGLFGALKRSLGGGGLFMTEFQATGAGGTVTFAPSIPGQIVEIAITPGKSFMVHRHGFVCATQGVEVSVGFQRSLGAGILGGEGMVLQKLTGSGTAWICLGGEGVTYDLQPGQVVQVHPGHIGLFEEGVAFDIVMMRGIRNALFGGDGLFIARLTGPGRIWLQSMTTPVLAHALLPYLESEMKQGR